MNHAISVGSHKQENKPKLTDVSVNNAISVGSHEQENKPKLTDVSVNHAIRVGSHKPEPQTKTYQCQHESCGQCGQPVDAAPPQVPLDTRHAPLPQTGTVDKRPCAGD